MNETILYSISSLIWLLFGFAIKTYIDYQFKQFEKDTNALLAAPENVDYVSVRQVDALKDEIINLVELLLSDAVSMEDQGDIFSYKISSALIHKLDTLFAQLGDMGDDSNLY